MLTRIDNVSLAIGRISSKAQLTSQSLNAMLAGENTLVLRGNGLLRS